MNIKNILGRIFKIKKKRYCPKCGVEMERVTIRSNSETVDGSSCLQCPQCQSILFNEQ